MLLCAEYVLPITSEPIEKGAVLVRDGEIRAIGAAKNLIARYPEEEVRDFGHAALLPGLIDAHTHLEYSAMRGMVHDVSYSTWLMAVNKKAGRMSSNDLTDSAILGGLEALSSGITCVGDITTSFAAVAAVQQLGMRGIVYREVLAMDKRRVDHAMKMATEDIGEWKDFVDSDRIQIGIAPAALYTCHPSVFSRITDYAGDTEPVALHVAGSREEYNFIRNGSSPFAIDILAEGRGYVELPPWLPTGATPVNYALNWGAFYAGNVMAVHCVHVDEDDIYQLKRYDVAIASCPRCNAQLGMGVAPIDEYLRADMRVGLGTDSPAATDSSDILAETRVGMLVQRSVHPETFISAHKMLELATIGGARALRMDDRIGSLETGKLADIVAVDLSGSHQTPTDDPASALVNTADGTDVLMTMIGGKILYEKNQWHVDTDVARTIAHVIEIREKLRK